MTKNANPFYMSVRDIYETIAELSDKLAFYSSPADRYDLILELYKYVMELMRRYNI